MAYRGQIAGDPSAGHEGVAGLLRARYDSSLGVHEINLHYVVGRGYHVTSATRTPTSGGAYKPGDNFDLPRREDISAEVMGVLRDAGFDVWE